MNEFAKKVRMPCCGKIVDVHSRFIVEEDGGIPREGDITICAGCGEIGVYTKELDVRAATDCEIFDINMSIWCNQIQWLQSKIKQRIKSKQCPPS